MPSISFLASEISRSLLAPLSGGIASNWIKPRIANVYLTSYCNSRCTMCDFWKGERNPNELNSEQWGVIFSRLKAFGVEYVGVNASGEIFTRPDLLRILSHLKSLKLGFGINSNGTLITKKKAIQLAELEPRVVTIGLDGVGDQNYLETRGLKSGFTKITHHIDYLKEAGIKNIRIGSVLMRENIDSWLPLCHFAQDQELGGIRFTAYHEGYFHADDEQRESPYQETAFLQRARTEIKRILMFKKETGLVNNSSAYLKSIPDYYAHGKGYFPHPCLQGSNRIELDVFGNVTLCSFIPSPLGNLLHQEMGSIWHSAAHKKARRDAFQGSCPRCYLSCYAEENLRLSTSGFFSTFSDTLQRGSKLLFEVKA